MVRVILSHNKYEIVNFRQQPHPWYLGNCVNVDPQRAAKRTKGTWVPLYHEHYYCHGASCVTVDPDGRIGGTWRIYSLAVSGSPPQLSIFACQSYPRDYLDWQPKSRCMLVRVYASGSASCKTSWFRALPMPLIFIRILKIIKDMRTH